MVSPIRKTQYSNSGHKIFGKSKNNGIIPIYNRVKCYQRKNFEYVHTCYKFDNMLTLYAIPFDLDFDKCSPRYKIDDKIDADLILNRLRKKYPEFLDVPMTLVRTKSGGISLLINISPVQYTDENGEPSENTSRTIWGLMQAQRNILKLLQNEGMGADSGAIGLARMVANYENPDLILYNNDRELLNKNRREKTNLLQILWKLTRNFNKISRLYNDTRVGSKIFKHFIELYEQTLEGRDLITVNHQFLLDSGLDVRTVRKIIARDLNDLPWLEVVAREKGQFICRLAGDLNDWELWVNDAKNYQSKKKYKKIRNIKNLKPPHLVADGERNRYLFSAAILLAHETSAHSHVLETMQYIASKIPNSDQSRNCRTKSLRAIANWAIKTCVYYRNVERNIPKWLWEIHISTEAPHGQFSPSGGFVTPKIDKKIPHNSKLPKLKYFKIGNNYGVVECYNNDYKLKLVGFVKNIKYLPSIATKLQIQTNLNINEIRMLEGTATYLPWWRNYQKRKHLLCGITNYLILYDPVIWNRLE